MARLTEDLSDASHQAAGRIRNWPAPCDLIDLPASRPSWHAPAPSATQFGSRRPPALQTQSARDRLAQLLSNLLTNAIRHTPGGEIRVRLWQEEAEVRLSPSDDGPGIPADQAELIFGPGHPLTERELVDRRTVGGLGLDIARGNSEAHGGRIWVETSPGLAGC